MLRGENYKVKQIDGKILEVLKEKLEIKKGNVDIISNEETEKVISLIEEKKKGIFLLFQGDFALNEKNISDKIHKGNWELNYYDRIANNVISRRIERIFNRMMNTETHDYRAISVYSDRYFFIQRILSENIQTSFIETCINDMER